MRLVTLAVATLVTAGAASADPLLEGRGDVDGKQGDEALRLDPDGTLHAGTASIAMTLDRADNVFDNQRRLEAISLGGKRRGVLLAMPTGAPEDPPNRYRVFSYVNGSLILVFDEVVESHLTFDRKGVGRYVESGWTACERAYRKAGNNVSAELLAPRLYEYALRLDKRGGKLVATRTLGRHVQKCDELSACPFVYELEAHREPWFAGEILRDLRGAKAYALQALALRARTAGTMRLRVTEEKPEVTYMDEIYVEIDGTRIAPNTCAAAPAPAYCVADGRYHVMVEGDELDLAFDVPAGARMLFARGYYLPR